MLVLRENARSAKEISDITKSRVIKKQSVTLVLLENIIEIESFLLSTSMVANVSNAAIVNVWKL
jgi:hypothetical protein